MIYLSKVVPDVNRHVPVVNFKKLVAVKSPENFFLSLLCYIYFNVTECDRRYVAAHIAIKGFGRYVYECNTNTVQ